MVKDLIPYYKQYKVKVEIFRNNEDKHQGRSIQVTIGMRRKGVAIAEDKNSLYLIDGNNLVLFECEREGSETYMEDYTCRIRRTISGYYIREQTGMSRTIWPGKDDSYKHETWISGVFYENGERCEEEWWKIKGRWNEFHVGEYPVEMGCGLVFYNNIFYEIESLKPRFIVPQSFTLESIFNEKKCKLNLSSDNKRLFVVIKNNQIENIVSLENQNEYFELVRRFDDISIFQSYITRDFETSDDNYNGKELEEIKRQKDKLRYAMNAFIREGYKQRLKEFYHYYIEIPTWPNFLEDNCLVESVFTIEDFMKNEISLTTNELKKIQKLHDLLKNDFEKNQNGLFVFRFARCYEYERDYGLDAIFYSDFFILRCQDNYKHINQYRFFDYSGVSISNKIYSYVGEYGKPNPFLRDRKGFIDFFNHVFASDCGQLRIEKNSIIEIPIPEVLINKVYPSKYGHHLTERKDYVEYLDSSNNPKIYHYYSRDGKEIEMNYTSVRVQESIPNIIFDIYPWYDYQINRYGKHDIKPKMIAGKLSLPNLEEFGSCIEEIKAKRQLFKQCGIKDVRRINTYFEGTDKEVILYYVDYHPMALCDTEGNINLQKIIPELRFLLGYVANDS
jgi:hypothetical protein